jgi:hypothetical protein
LGCIIMPILRVKLVTLMTRYGVLYLTKPFYVSSLLFQCLPLLLLLFIPVVDGRDLVVH